MTDLQKSLQSHRKSSLHLGFAGSIPKSCSKSNVNLNVSLSVVDYSKIISLPLFCNWPCLHYRHFIAAVDYRATNQKRKGKD